MHCSIWASLNDMRKRRPEADQSPSGSLGRLAGVIAALCVSVLAVTAAGWSVLGSTTGADMAGPGTEETEATDVVTSEQQHPYVGLWVTADNRVRQRLLPNGRYVEARGDDESAYTGRYEVTGDHVEYWDDSGFTADGEFRDDVLYHGGMVMRRAAD